jgi:hypothetical protein
MTAISNGIEQRPEIQKNSSDIENPLIHTFSFKPLGSSSSSEYSYINTNIISDASPKIFRELSVDGHELCRANPITQDKSSLLHLHSSEHDEVDFSRYFDLNEPLVLMECDDFSLASYDEEDREGPCSFDREDLSSFWEQEITASPTMVSLASVDPASTST